MTARPLALVLSTCTLIAAAGAERTASAATFGQFDDFQSGTVLGWGGSTTSNAANSGPAGVGDNALSVNSTGRVVAQNTSQWTGDYNAAGITKIMLDVKHQNAFNLDLRVGIAKGAVGMNGIGDTYVSGASVPVANDGQWHRIALDLDASAFVPHPNNNNPTPSAATALANVTTFRILHNTVANYLGANGPATFMLDNIRAVPEPTSFALGACAAAVVALARSRRNR